MFSILWRLLLHLLSLTYGVILMSDCWTYCSLFIRKLYFALPWKMKSLTQSELINTIKWQFSWWERTNGGKSRCYGKV